MAVNRKDLEEEIKRKLYKQIGELLFPNKKISSLKDSTDLRDSSDSFVVDEDDVPSVNEEDFEEQQSEDEDLKQENEDLKKRLANLEKALKVSTSKRRKH